MARDPGRDPKGDKRWARAPRLPLADFFHPRPVYVAAIAELRGPREEALARWLRATREGVLVIHRTHCRLGKSTRADGQCTCSPSYLNVGACA